MKRDGPAPGPATTRPMKTSTQPTTRRCAAALLTVIAAATIIGPAVAASEDECAIAVVDAVEVIDLADLEPPASHSMSKGIAAIAAVAQLPGRVAIGVQQTVEGLAKATPRVLRAIL